jgi:catechol 2,3-dioxygenase-like lactoylglutathione lyase family enzyme
MKLLRVDHVLLAMPPGQEEKAREFYGRILGLSEVVKPTALAGRGGAWFEHGDLKIHLGVEKNFVPARKAHPAFLVEDLAALAARLAAESYPVTTDEPMPGYHRIFTHDPFGNRIELMERRADGG